MRSVTSVLERQAQRAAEPDRQKDERDSMQVRFELFRSSMKSWTTLSEEAAAFATEVGRERLINISVSAADTGAEGVIFVWYWE